MRQVVREAGVDAREMRAFLLAVTFTETRIMPSTLWLPPSPAPGQPSLFLCLFCETPSCLGLVGSVPQPHTQAAPVVTTALLPSRCTQPHPSTVCLGSQPPTCHRAVPPSHPLPLPPVSGRQLQLCPLLSEQVDSDAQSHKPWVGMKFFFVSFSFVFSSLLPSLPPPLYSTLPLPSGPTTSHISPPLFLFPLSCIYS